MVNSRYQYRWGILMEKLMYVLWKPTEESNETFKSKILQHAMHALRDAGSQHIRLTISDDAVSPAQKLFIRSTQPSPDAVISFWLNSAIARQPLENILQAYASRISGYLVTESEPLRNEKYPSTTGQRTYGMNQVVLLRRPSRLNVEEWIDIWHNSHTQVALETQSTFGYRQNVVARPLTHNALAIDAIVEENFPPEAMNSAHAFYRAAGDDALMKKNRSEMFASVQRFIDFDQLDCLPMSEYNF